MAEAVAEGAKTDDTASTEKPVEDAGQAKDTQDDLQVSLQEYEEREKLTPEPKSPPKEDLDTSQRLDLLEKKEADRGIKDDDQASKTAVEGIVKNLRKQQDRLVSVSDNLIEGYIVNKANSDKRIYAAFQNRGSNPAIWSKIEAGLAKELAGEFNLPNPDLTADHQSAQVAARGISTTPPVTPTDDGVKPQSELAKMTPDEFDAYEAETIAEHERR